MHCACQIIWLHSLFQELGFNQDNPSILYLVMLRSSLVRFSGYFFELQTGLQVWFTNFFEPWTGPQRTHLKGLVQVQMSLNLELDHILHGPQKMCFKRSSSGSDSSEP